MGIKKLFTFLDEKELFEKYPYLSDIVKNLKIDKNKFIIGVDANLYCYKYSYSYGNMLIGFYNQILKFYSNNIIPIYIFDGGVLKEKEATTTNRNKKIINNKIKIDELNEDLNNIENIEEINNLEIIKNKLQKKSIKITSVNLKLLLELFDLLNIPFIFSHCEGEYLAVLLNKLNIIDMFLTDDTDPIPGGIKKTVKFYNNCVYYLDCELVLNTLKLTSNEFIDMCILMGNDYNNFFHKIEPNIIYKNILKYKSIENIIKNIDDIDKDVDENNACDDGRYDSLKLFIKNHEINIDNIENIRNIYKNLYNFERESFVNIHTENEFNISKITNHDDISNYSIVMLEFWNEFIAILKQNSYDNFTKSNKLKKNINNYIKNSKFNTSKIIKFMKNNINEISSDEINNISTTFDFLNEFGIGN
jgi:hypothetical protein